jgi:serine phosphatase RsbU (regulator of sigma subunit)
MSKIILCFIISLCFLSSVQSQTTLKDKIFYPEDYSFHYGDNTIWAQPDFDDSQWERVAIDSFPSEEWNGIGWFRLWVEIDTSLIRKRLGFSPKIIGSLDVFVDGRYRFSFGMVGSDIDEEKPLFVNTYLPPELFRFRSADSVYENRSRHLIALRYSSFLLESPVSIGIKPSFDIQIDDFDYLRLEQREIRRKAKAYQMLFIGIFLSFALIHLLLYFFYTDLKANLYFAAMITMGAILTFLRFDAFFISDSSRYLLNFILLGICIIFFLLAMLKICYYLLNITKSKIYTAFIIITIVLGIIFIFRPFRMWWVLIIFEIIIMIEILRNLVLYITKPRELHLEGSWIILVGLFPVGVVGLFQLLTSLNISRQYWEAIDLPLTYFALVGFAISMSIFLSRTFAKTNKDLKKQLEQVKFLSEKTLKQELEQVKLEAENRRKSEELEQARNLQLSMLPKTVPEIKNVKIAVSMKTATEVGGDYYDFVVDRDKTLTIAFGDATGHGMQAGSVVTATKSLFKSYASLKNPVQIQKQISDPLRLMGFKRLVMAMIIAKIKNYNMQVSVAGMPFPLIYRAGSDAVEEISISGMPLGSFDEFPYKSTKLNLNKDDKVLFMSDGFQEMFNEQGDILGDERVIAGFKACARRSPEEIISELNNLAKNWAGNRPQEDDMTLMVIRFK